MLCDKHTAREQSCGAPNHSGKLGESVFFHISRWCETGAQKDVLETLCATDMRYIGMYEHMRKTLKTWDVRSMEGLKFETFVIMGVLSFSDEDCHRDIITVVDKTTHSRFTDR